jgi:ABC-type polysaccharide transport system permease subunit
MGIVFLYLINQTVANARATILLSAVSIRIGFKAAVVVALALKESITIHMTRMIALH